MTTTRMPGTAGELKALLEKISDDTLIKLDGCDCAEFWGGQHLLEPLHQWDAEDLGMDTKPLVLELVRIDHHVGEVINAARTDTEVRSNYQLP